MTFIWAHKDFCSERFVCERAAVTWERCMWEYVCVCYNQHYSYVETYVWCKHYSCVKMYVTQVLQLSGIGLLKAGRKKRICLLLYTGAHKSDCSSCVIMDVTNVLYVSVHWCSVVHLLHSLTNMLVALSRKRGRHRNLGWVARRQRTRYERRVMIGQYSSCLECGGGGGGGGGG